MRTYWCAHRREKTTVVAGGEVEAAETFGFCRQRRSGDLLSTEMIARGRAWHGDDDSVVDGGRASLTARQSVARASAADELNYEFRQLEAAGGYEGGGDEMRE